MLKNYQLKNGKLDAQTYGDFLTNILTREPFFRRFTQDELKPYLASAKPEYYDKDEIIFVDGRVGIITHGSVIIRSHKDSIMSPTIEAKYGKGKILGHESDDGITSNPQSWLLAYDEQTEILFFPKELFEGLWRKQLLKVDKKMIEAAIESNSLLHCLSD